MRSNAMPYLRSLLGALVLVLATAAQSAGVPDTTKDGARLQSVQALLAALKRQNVEHRAGREATITEIESDLRAVEALVAAGQTAQASPRIEALYQKTRGAIAALQPASIPKSTLSAPTSALPAMDTPRLRSLYQRRESSVVALLEAGKRVVGEGVARPAGLLQSEQQLTAAREQAQQGDYPVAITLLEQSGQGIAGVIRGLREGQEVVASKHFLTPADEFGYEQARNEDYLQLIDSLLESAPNANWSERAQQSRRLHGEAVQAARIGEWTQALERIHQSTLGLKGILRAAGFPIM